VFRAPAFASAPAPRPPTKYTKSADAAVAWLRPRVLDEAWVAGHDDVACYFKATVTLLEAGSEAEARQVLETATTRYLERGALDSNNEAYASFYPHYPWMWMCWSAVRLGRKDLAEKCYSKLYEYVRPDTGGAVVGRVKYASGLDLDMDLYATAEVVKVGLLTGRHDVAELSANKLLQVVEANRGHMENGRFYLHWKSLELLPGLGGKGFGADGEALVLEEDLFRCVLRDTPGQLYFMLALPALHLLETAEALAAQKASASEAYRAGALALLSYLKSCAGLYESPWCHKVGRAAAKAGDAETATRVADFLVSLQQPAGCYQEDPEDMENVNQTAEIACWLYQIQQDLDK